MGIAVFAEPPGQRPRHRGRRPIQLPDLSISLWSATSWRVPDRPRRQSGLVLLTLCLGRPVTAAQAAGIILPGVQAGTWRILIGDDAEFIDTFVRTNPEGAYDYQQMAQMAAGRRTADAPAAGAPAAGAPTADGLAADGSVPVTSLTAATGTAHIAREGIAMATPTEAGLVEMRLVKVVALAISDGDPSNVVVLEAVSQDQVLPIEIGPAEAFNLAAALTGVELARPMAPQFAVGLVRALGGRVRQVRIDRLIPMFGGNALGAVVEVEGPAGIEVVDARPSDALNLLALMPAPVFASPEVLAEAAARMAGDSAEATLLRHALELEQMTVRQRHHHHR
jgi:bifunctional DNase/RNase